MKKKVKMFHIFRNETNKKDNYLKNKNFNSKRIHFSYVKTRFGESTGNYGVLNKWYIIDQCLHAGVFLTGFQNFPI